MARFIANGAFQILPSTVKNYSLNPHWVWEVIFVFSLGQYVVCTAVQDISNCPIQAVDICIMFDVSQHSTMLLASAQLKFMSNHRTLLVSILCCILATEIHNGIMPLNVACVSIWVLRLARCQVPTSRQITRSCCTCFWLLSMSVQKWNNSRLVEIPSPQ